MSSISLEVLSNSTVTVFSAERIRQQFIQDIDCALEEVKSAYSATTRSPVKLALKLLRSVSNLKTTKDENARAVSLAQEVASGQRSLFSLPRTEISLLRRALRTRRNSLAPISRLPNEVLALILELSPTRDYTPAGIFIFGSAASHVCHRWRETTLRSPLFWSDIDLLRPRWAREKLEKSQVAPLTVRANLGWNRKASLAAHNLVLAQLDRIRELHLDLRPAQCCIPAALFLPAPILETFRLSCEPPWPTYSVPAELFQGDAAALRHLSLRSCRLEWNSPLLEKLVSLELISVELNLGMDEFLAVLARMPSLRALTIKKSFPRAYAATEPLSLSLETVHLTLDSRQCFHLLRAVSIPECRIVMEVDDSRGPWVWGDLEIPQASSAELSLYALHLMDLPYNSGGFEVKLFNRRDYWNTVEPEPRYTIRFKIPVRPLPHWRENIICKLMERTFTYQVNILTVKCAGFDLCAAMLHRKRFRTAVFHGDVEHFLAPLANHTLLLNLVKSTMQYPRLNRIDFHDTVFSDRQLEIFLDWLAQRKRLDSGIHEIRFFGSFTLSTAVLRALGESVGNVYVGK